MILLLTACGGAPDVGSPAPEEDEPPLLTFVAPLEGDTYAEQDAVALSVQVIDDRDPVEHIEFVWTLDGDPLAGELTTTGLNAIWTVSGHLPAGVHNLGVAATDLGGNTTNAQVTIIVVANEAPVLTFEAPLDGTEVWDIDTLAVDLVVVDEGAGAVLSWTGADGPTELDAEGHASFTLTGLEPGTHTLTAEAADSLGATGSASVSYTVRDADADGDGSLSVEAGGDDCDDEDADANPGADELCNDVDDDCDGDVDSTAIDRETWYLDGDGDGFGAEEASGCAAPVGSASVGGDCDDTRGDVFPGATEVCDDLDDDCDGDIDGGAVDAGTWFVDADGDHYGADAIIACDAPVGSATVDGDCDDADDAVFPGAVERCNDMDDDCDGDVDGTAVDQRTWFVDADGDTFGSTAALACDAPAGTVSIDGDCDDTDDAVSPRGVEVCNGVDDDCDGDADSTAVDREIWYVDGDGDGFGATEVVACEAPAGTVSDRGDCDDEAETVNPWAVEVCNDVDDDCDGIVDLSAVDMQTWYGDHDGDGFGSGKVTGCDRPEGVVDEDGDCEDVDASIHPGAEDECGDGVDADCDAGDTPCFWTESWTFEEAALRIDSEDAGAQLGSAAIFLPDQDGDGLDDLAFSLDQSGADSGGVRVWSGTTRGALLLDGTPRSRLLNDENHEYTGYTMATGDVDGDGAVDLVVGEPDLYSSSGSVYLLPLPLPAGDSHPVDLAIATWTGSPADSFGRAVVSLPDLDGDGADEVVIGADGTYASAGQAWVHLVPGGTLGSAAAIDVATMTITEPFSTGLGSELADAGDVDGDGRNELLVRASGSGAVYLLAPDPGLARIGDAEWVFSDAGTSTWGEPIDGGGDLDGDGYGDVVIGDRDADTAYVARGDAARAPGSTGIADVSLRVYGDPGDNFGVAVEIAGDLDGDGWLDLLVGAETADFGGSGSSGGVIVFCGPIVDGLTRDDADAAMAGDDASSDFGETLDGDGDVDGDGLADFLTGAASYSGHSTSGGAAFLIRGAPR